MDAFFGGSTKHEEKEEGAERGMGGGKGSEQRDNQREPDKKSQTWTRRGGHKKAVGEEREGEHPLQPFPYRPVPLPVSS